MAALGLELRLFSSSCREWGLRFVAVWGLPAAAASPIPEHRLQGTWALELGLSSRSTRALLPHGMGDLPRPGIEPTSPALSDRFLTTGPLETSQYFKLKY